VGLDAIDEQLLAQLAGRARAAQRTTTPMPAPWIMRSLRS
jgi:hypothetical protein